MFYIVFKQIFSWTFFLFWKYFYLNSNLWIKNIDSINLEISLIVCKLFLINVNIKNQNNKFKYIILNKKYDKGKNHVGDVLSRKLVKSPAPVKLLMNPWLDGVCSHYAFSEPHS